MTTKTSDARLRISREGMVSLRCNNTFLGWALRVETTVQHVNPDTGATQNINTSLWRAANTSDPLPAGAPEPKLFATRAEAAASLDV